uniref:Uncharacterized protein n=1 Tax=Glossina austeni TaxID=7395 RepID=A0A1A9VCX3_GLOAU
MELWSGVCIFSSPKSQITLSQKRPQLVAHYIRKRVRTKGDEISRPILKIAKMVLTVMEKSCQPLGALKRNKREFNLGTDDTLLTIVADNDGVVIVVVRAGVAAATAILLVTGVIELVEMSEEVEIE